MNYNEFKAKYKVKYRPDKPGYVLYEVGDDWSPLKNYDNNRLWAYGTQHACFVLIPFKRLELVENFHKYGALITENSWDEEDERIIL